MSAASPSRVVRTACTRDCPDACGLLAETNGQRVLRLRGDPEHPHTQGFLCYRTHRFLERQESPQRLTRPLRRNGAGRLVEVSTQEAVAHVAALVQDAVRRHGPASILHLGGGGSLGMMKLAWSALLSRVGAITETRGGICVGAGYEALRLDVGGRDSPDPATWAQARQVLLWGKNPHVVAPHLIPFLRAAREAGARIVNVDPLATRAVELSHQAFHPAPGSDWALGLLLLRAAVERGCVRPDVRERVVGWNALESRVRRGDVAAWRARVDLPERQLDLLVQAVLEHRPSAWVVGWGLQRHVLGGTALRVLHALAYALGDVGVAGGGFHFAYTRKRGLDVSWAEATPPARTVPQGRVARALRELADPPIHLLLVDNANPVAQHGDTAAHREALRRVPHLVVTDAFLTDTAELAELVLPAATMLEEQDLVGSYGQPYLALVQPVVPPPGEARPDLEWCRLLAPHLGVDPALFDATALLDRTLAPLAAHGVDRVRLAQGAVKNPGAPRTGVALEGGVTFHPDGKFHALTELPVEPAPDPAFPLWLLSVSQRERQSSQVLDEPPGPPPAVMHPEVAARAGLADGAPATLVSPQGSLAVVLRLDATQRRDTVQVGKGGWLAHGKAVNLLTSDAPTDLGDGTAFYSARVRLEPAPPSDG